MNKRVGLEKASLSKVYMKAHANNISSIELPTLPEQDDWVYDTNRWGKPAKSMVMICHQLVCRTLRAAGVFKGKQFNCNELTLYDVYKLKIFDPNFKRPSQCVEADPENPLCQLNGDIELRLDKYPGSGERFNVIEPQDGIGEHCPSLGPEYTSDPYC